MKKKILLMVGFLFGIDSYNCQTLLWTKYENWGTGSTMLNHIKVDPSNNVLVAGGYGGTMSSGCGGMYLSKYSPSGMVLWSDTLNYGNLNCGLASDPVGNIYNLIYHYPDFHFIKYNTSGSKILDVAPIKGNIQGLDMQVGKDGFIYLSGQVMYSAIFGSDTLNSGGFISKLDNLGQLIWTKHIKITSNNTTDWAKAIRFEYLPNGDIYLLGVLTGNATVSGFNLTGYYSSFLINLKSNGTVTNAFLLPALCEDMSVDTNKVIYFKGEFSGSVSFGSNIVNQTSGTYGSYFVAAWNKSGWLWAKELPDFGRGAIATDLYSNIYCLGNWHDSNNKCIYNVQRFNTLGNSTWSYTSPPSALSGYYQANALEIDNLGDLYIGGYDAHAFLSKFSFFPTSSKEIDNDNFDFFVYPNPTQGFFQIHYSSNERGKLQLRIINSAGETVYAEALPNFNGELNKTINLSNKPKGIYFIEIIADKKRSVKKIVLN